MKVDLKIDTRGLFCPLPVVKVSQSMDDLDAGAVIEVLSDDPAIEFDMPAWCQSAGHKIKSFEKKANKFRFLIIKSG